MVTGNYPHYIEYTHRPFLHAQFGVFAWLMIFCSLLLILRWKSKRTSYILRSTFWIKEFEGRCCFKRIYIQHLGNIDRLINYSLSKTCCNLFNSNPFWSVLISFLSKAILVFQEHFSLRLLIGGCIINCSYLHLLIETQFFLEAKLFFSLFCPSVRTSVWAYYFQRICTCFGYQFVDAYSLDLRFPTLAF